MKSNVYRQELMFVTSFEFGSLPLCHQVFCRCTASLSEHTGTRWGGEEKQRSSAACCTLPWWNWTINILPNLPSLSVTTLQLETCLCPLILYQQLFSPSEVLLSFSIPVLTYAFTCHLGFKKEKPQNVPACAGLYFSMCVTMYQWLLDKVVCACCLQYPLWTLTCECFTPIWVLIEGRNLWEIQGNFYLNLLLLF